MAQHDYDIADQAGLAFLADLNAALAAGVTLNSGATEPATKYPGMLWLDTSVTPPVLRIRDQANSSWGLPIAKADVGLGSVENYGVASQAEAEAGIESSKYMTPLRTAQALLAPFAANQSLLSSGFQIMPSGLVIQWGTATPTGPAAVTFPTAFPNACLQVVATPFTNTLSASSVGVYAGGYTTTQFTAVGYKVSDGAAASVAISWIAVGH